MYEFKFAMVGGTPRVRIDSGEDIRHLRELDQKLWTVLSCPVTGLELEEKSLRLMDYNNDGKIHVNELLTASEWLCGVLKNADILLEGKDHLALSEINREHEDGEKIYQSAKQILTDLGRAPESDAAEISIADTADSIAIFSKTLFNGDGVIIPGSTEEDALRQLIEEVMKYIGTVVDRSGLDGINAEQIEEFYAEADAFVKWHDSKTDATFPLADATEAAYAAVKAVEAKIDDYFTRCALAKYDGTAAPLLDVAETRYQAIAEKALSVADADINSFPLSHVNAESVLSFEAINPAWAALFGDFCAKVVAPLFPEAKELTAAQWNEIKAKFVPYADWTAAHAGDKVAELGLERLRAIVTENRKEALLEIVAKDAALQTQVDSISLVEKLLRLNRDFYALLRNYVTFSDFYSPEKDVKAIFQAGTLYIDQRACDLCLRVSDMGAQAVNASFSGMYLIYCTCTSKTLNKTMDIVAALTVGDVQSVRVGKNALFYDRQGNDWDAIVTKIVDNPISIGQAFWSPYRKLANFIEEQVNKMAAAKESKMMDNATTQIAAKTDEVGNMPTDPAAVQQMQLNEKKKEAFDIAKFCGIFAAIGMALGAIGTALTAVVSGFLGLKIWQMPLVIAAILLIISGPSMIIAWLKLRRRNLSPLLNANGWAINSRVIVNIVFGGTLTSMAKLPKLNLKELRKNDPFKKEGIPTWKWILHIVILVAVVVALLYWLNPWNMVDKILGRDAVEPETEVVADSAAVESAEAPVVEEVAEEVVEEAPAE